MPPCKYSENAGEAAHSVAEQQRLAVLAVQESHLTVRRIEDLNSLFGARIDIVGSGHPTNETGAAGVAFIINKNALMGREFATRELIPGRAMMLSYPWTSDKKLNILNIYAPNAAAENAAFWTTLREMYERGEMSRPDAMLGDFNVVEEALDRLPPHLDAENAVAALRTLCTTFRLADLWRRAHPNERCYTFRQTGTGVQSRIDRIYTANERLAAVADWSVVGTGVLSDHQLVMLSIANYHAPEVGSGRWTMPLPLLDDAVFRTTMKELGQALQEHLDRPGAGEGGPQQAFANFKTALRDAARRRAKEWTPKLDRKIAKIKAREPSRLRATGCTERRWGCTG
ncbi:Endonuclease/exonuclease/phosphatase [Lenzites betulinus]|nr:Endonuclease/exonuclease/phosphatase [Lenzites betulinus]